MVLKQYELTSFGETKRLLSISDVLFDQLLFKEKLHVYDKNGKRVGRFSVAVDEEEIQKCRAFVVHISNRGILTGRLSETIVTGILTQNMKTSEEVRYEASEVENEKHERRFYLLREKTKYYYSLRESICNVTIKQQKTIPFSKTSGLIGEAANIVLMRSIAIRGYEGIFCLRTILSNGKKCRNYYVSKLAKRMVKGVKMDVVIIYRSVTDHKKYSVTTTCSFTRAGQLLHLYWSNSDYFLHIDPDVDVYGRMVDENNEVGLHKRWNRDIQIFSYYLDRMVEMEAKIRTYRNVYHEATRAMATWIQGVMIMKPSDILSSAVEFFTSFDFEKSK